MLVKKKLNCFFRTKKKSYPGKVEKLFLIGVLEPFNLQLKCSGFPFLIRALRLLSPISEPVPA